jgi:hypothetical protein
MKNGNSTTTTAMRPEYSGGHIFFARLFFLAEAGLTLYMIFSRRMEYGILYLIYALISIFLLMPLLRCAQCDYFGRRCSLGWGAWASKMVADEYRGLFKDQTGLNIIFWPLRLIPILFGISDIVGALIKETFAFENYYIYGSYLLVLILQRLFFHTRVCPASLNPATLS